MHLPTLAYTNGPLEEDFLFLLERHRLPLPRFNVRLHGILVDAYWRAVDLVVELDGGANHGTPAQLRRDAADTAALRAKGLTVKRFDSHAVRHRELSVLASLTDAGVRRSQPPCGSP
jgi:very-short-patch-repair endonuclease